MQIIRGHAEDALRASKWYGQFSVHGRTAFGPASKALADYCLRNRAQMWHLLSWHRHDRAPTTVAQKAGLFAELDVTASMPKLLQQCPDFFQHSELASACACAEWIKTDPAFFEQVCAACLGKHPALATDCCDVTLSLMTRFSAAASGHESILHSHTAAHVEAFSCMQELRAMLTPVSEPSDKRQASVIFLVRALCEGPGYARAMRACLDILPTANQLTALSGLQDYDSSQGAAQKAEEHDILDPGNADEAAQPSVLPRDLAAQATNMVFGTQWEDLDSMLLAHAAFCRAHDTGAALAAHDAETASALLHAHGSDASSNTSAAGVAVRSGTLSRVRHFQQRLPPQVVLDRACSAVVWALGWLACPANEQMQRLQEACKQLGWHVSTTALPIAADGGVRASFVDSAASDINAAPGARTNNDDDDEDPMASWLQMEHAAKRRKRHKRQRRRHNVDADDYDYKAQKTTVEHCAGDQCDSAASTVQSCAAEVPRVPLRGEAYGALIELCASDNVVQVERRELVNLLACWHGMYAGVGTQPSFQLNKKP